MKLSDISPLAGMLTGEGAMGKLMAKGFGGAIPSAIARDAQKAREAEEAQAAETKAAEAMMAKRDAEARAAQGMKKGGKVSSVSKRADGCCSKGHTRGKMV